MSRPILACLPVLCAATLFSTLVPVNAQARRDPYYNYYRKAIRDDLLAIPAGTPATDTQKAAVSDDLDKLFPYVFPLPTVNIDFLADQLAAAVSTGVFTPDDVAVLAKELVAILNRSYFIRTGKLDALRANLTRGQVDPARVTQIVAALSALGYGYGTDSYSTNLGNDLQVVDPGVAGYKNASGSVNLSTYLRSTFDNYGVVTSSASVGHSLSVQVNQLPPGRYLVSVTTSPGGANVELGTLGVRKRSPITVTGAAGPVSTGGSGTVISGPGARYGYVSFSDSDGDKPLPAGLSLERVTGVTITDAQGTARFTGSLLANSPGISTTQNAQLHLQATGAAPTVGGTLYFTNVQSYDPNRNFTLEAVGLPVSATLTLSVNGQAVGPVTTGPTGKLYVKEYSSYFNLAPGPTEIVNLLPDAVDLSVARTFTLSDAQGVVLASAGE